MFLLSLELEFNQFLSVESFRSIFLLHLLHQVSIYKLLPSLSFLSVLLLFNFEFLPLLFLFEVFLAHNLLMLFPFLFCLDYEALSIVFFVFKIFSILNNFILSTNKFLLYSLLFRLLCDQLVGESFISDSNLINLSLILLAKDQFISGQICNRCGHDRAGSRRLKQFLRRSLFHDRGA